MEKTKKMNLEIIREGFAKARFGGTFSGGVIQGMTTPINLAAVENNGGLNPEEYFVTNCRLLSAAVTPYRRFDFTRDGVLKSAVSLFDGLTLYANHYADVNDWKGMVQEPVWDETNVPAGINAKAVLDRTVDPKLARGVETKALRSFSVTIWFTYEKSHPDLKNFYDYLGEEVEGEMVRLIVTQITQAGEVSVVWEGEDPFAKSFNAEPGDPGSGKDNHQTGGKDMKFTATILTLLGIAAGTEVTVEMLEEKVTGVITGLKNEIAKLQPDAALGVQLLTETRERAVTLYKTVKGEKFQQAFIDGVIGKADLVTARALVSEYEAEIDKSIPLTCPKCGETLARRSSLETGNGQTEAGGKRAEDYKL
ncbi:MAG: hypothetical protein ABFD59_04315 [Smithella sp.]